MGTSCTTDLGCHKCGTELSKHPIIDLHSSVSLCGVTNAKHPASAVPHAPFGESDDELSKDRGKLFILPQRCAESLRSTIRQTSVKVPVTGTLRDTGERATAAFQAGQHQSKSFELIAAAFIVQLCNTPRHFGKMQRQKEKIVNNLRRSESRRAVCGIPSWSWRSRKVRSDQRRLAVCKATLWRSANWFQQKSHHSDSSRWCCSCARAWRDHAWSLPSKQK